MGINLLGALALFLLFNVDPGGNTTETLVSVLTTEAAATQTTIAVPLVFEYLAVFAGAISGSLIAVDRKFDIVGVVVLALIVGLGGGIIRDMLMVTDYIYILESPSAVVGCVIIALLVFYFREIIDKLTNAPMFIFDILSVGLFCFTGAEKAIQAGYGVVAAIMLGTMTGIGGGVIRDISLNEIPQVFRQGNFYAIAGFAGAFTYVSLVELHIIKLIAAIMCVAVTTALRVLSVKLNWRTTTSVDLSQHVVKPIKQIFRYPEANLEVNEPEDAYSIEAYFEESSESRPSKKVVIVQDIEETGTFQALSQEDQDNGQESDQSKHKRR